MGGTEAIESETGDSKSPIHSSHVVQNQDAVFRFLAKAETHGLDHGVSRIDTHGAVVFLAGGDVYKVKRAVLFPFMDFSTLAKRRRACEAELVVNRPNAPGIYLDVVPIVSRGGSLHIGGDGLVVEWAVHMRRFDERMTLDHVTASGGLTPILIERLAAAIACAHDRAPARVGVDFATALHGLIDENARSLRETPALFDPRRVAALIVRSREELDRIAGTLRERAARGYVRRCHGDLHLRNIVIIGDRPTLFDALEFDENLATIDILYDLAFLLMDVTERGLRFEGNLLLNRYLVSCRDASQIAGLAALPLFMNIRAAIRAKVIAAGLGHLDAAARLAAMDAAKRYFAFAETSLDVASSRLVAIGGLSGTGKSTIAMRLALLIGCAPGALHLRSDIERKRQLGTSEGERLPASSYDKATTDAVYRALRHQAAVALRAGLGVVVDAVHRHVDEREAIRQVAVQLGVPFDGLWLEAAVELRIARVSKREHDASDADATVAASQVEEQPNANDWRRIDAKGQLDQVLGRARAALALG